MASTAIVAVRRALVAAVSALPAFENVQVLYAWRDNPEREIAFTNSATFHHEPASMRSGRNFRNEDGKFEFTIWVVMPGGSPEDAAIRALELGLAFEEYVADHKNGIAGEQWLLIQGDGALTEMHNDSGSAAELTYPIAYNARLT